MGHFRVAVLGLGFLAACGGSGGGSGPTFALDSFDAIAARGDRIQLAGASAEPASRSLLGSSGTATYDGVMFLNVPSIPTVAVLGEIALDVDLSNGTLRGEAGNFFNFIEEPAPGTLQVTNGVVSGTESAIFTADLDGEIAFEDESRVIDASLFGTFGGDRGELILGGQVGTGTTASGVTATVDGNILLER